MHAGVFLHILQRVKKKKRKEKPQQQQHIHLCLHLGSATMLFVIFASPPNHSGFLSNNQDVAEVHTVSFNSQDVTEVLFTAVVAIFIHSTPFSFLNVIHLLMSLMTHLLDIVVRQSPVVG